MKRATDETPARAGGEGMRPLLLVMALCDALNSNGPTIISHRCSRLPPNAISLALKAKLLISYPLTCALCVISLGIK